MQMKCIALAATVLLATTAYAEDAGAFKDKKQQQSYAIGAQTARTLRRDSVDVDEEMLVRGIRDGLADARLLLSDKELRAVMSHVQQDIHRNMVMNRRAVGERNKEQGAAYLAENAKKPGVVTTASGLQYRIVKSGTGPKPALGETVLVNFRGTFLDGSEFDASEDGKPAQMVAAQAMTGWKEALQMMPAGSRWQLAVPSHLAYGDRGAGANIGPNQVLLFDIELVSVQKH
jgi:FKBP-type peptidyl-prolyl cis-trans isomerase FklB